MCVCFDICIEVHTYTKGCWKQWKTMWYFQYTQLNIWTAQVPTVVESIHGFETMKIYTEPTPLSILSSGSLSFKCRHPWGLMYHNPLLMTSVLKVHTQQRSTVLGLRLGRGQYSLVPANTLNRSAFILLIQGLLIDCIVSYLSAVSWTGLSYLRFSKL